MFLLELLEQSIDMLLPRLQCGQFNRDRLEEFDPWLIQLCDLMAEITVAPCALLIRRASTKSFRRW